eukprot:TRINITY_DN67270_c0_g1_i2.p1 TRINITY_DN67270_c0_g1~~TRINITY_DN67270_c0_g1_i2.p1  ORF type:complete len:264 (+),score=37.89 TRINITY_DN67270_c0_g1_i2:32-823(+)
MSLFHTLLALATLCSVCTAQTIVLPSKPGGGPANITMKKFRAYNTNVFYATIDNPRDTFHIYASLQPDKKCGDHEKTDDQAKKNGCALATNGGPFKFTVANSCLGYVISDGKVLNVQSTGNANFGLLTNGSFILGELKSSEFHQLNFSQLVSGFGWLTYKGKVLPRPGGEIAPRTTIGVDPEGRLVIVVIDGVEKHDPPIGTTLYQTGAVLQKLGIRFSINLDGGGSTALWYDNKIYDKPTCHDIPHWTCVRPVTTTTCIKSP